MANQRDKVALVRSGDGWFAVATSQEFEARVKKAVIDRLDHKHLNDDVPEFAKLNPSVENIARVVWGLLGDRLMPAKLRRVRVWEFRAIWPSLAWTISQLPRGRHRRCPL